MRLLINERLSNERTFRRPVLGNWGSGITGASRRVRQLCITLVTGFVSAV
jgi:hypothetical protein